MSSRTVKAKEIIEDQNIIEVLNLWNNSNDDINKISEKTGLSKKEIDMILISHEATKHSSDLYKKKDFILLSSVLIDKNKIVAIYESEKTTITCEPLTLDYNSPISTHNKSLVINILLENQSNIIEINGMTLKEVLNKLNLGAKT